MVVVGDQPADRLAHEPADHDHQEVKKADHDQKAHLLSVRRAVGQQPQRQRNGERIEAQGYSEQQYGEQVHRGKKFAQKYEELFVFGVPSY